VDKIRIQNALIDLALNGTFYLVSYDADHKAVLGAAVAPAEALANEVTSGFDEPERNRRRYRRDRTEWIWQLRVGFHQEVVLDAFEEAWNASPIFLPADSGLGYRRCSLELRRSNYTHPPTQDPKGGTKVVYEVNARLWPV
jgi:hypothetical protein